MLDEETKVSNYDTFFYFMLYYIVSNYVVSHSIINSSNVMSGVQLNIRDATVNKARFSTSWTFYSSGENSDKNTMLTMIAI